MRPGPDRRTAEVERAQAVLPVADTAGTASTGKRSDAEASV